MENLFNSLTKLISPEMVSKASEVLGENSSNVSSAISGIIPSVLGTILEKGNNNPQLESALKEAGNSGLLSNITGLFSGDSDSKTQNSSSDLLHSLFGDKLDSFTSLISSTSGVSNSGVGKLLSMLTPLIGGFLGNKLNSGLSMPRLLGQLSSEKSSFLSAIPSGLAGVLGISSLASLDPSFLSSSESKLKDIKDDVSSKVEHTIDSIEHTAKGGGTGWLKWFILLVILLFLAWWLLSKNSCSGDTKNIEGTTESVIEGAKTSVQSGIDKISKEISLPSGFKLTGYEGGMEDQITKFLTSDAYKKATPEELKEKWFDFDAINFKFGSGTELTPESETQLKNIGAILKEFKDAKIKIGAYTDKKGDAAINLKIAQERANTIKSLLTKDGLGSQITGAEGYGSEFAKVDVNASDEERAKDRKIAIRFEK